MLKVNCYNCHWSWSLTPDAAREAYETLEPDDKYYTAICPQCGRTNKVSVKQLKKALPRESSSSSE